MKGYFLFPLIEDSNIKIDSSVIFGDSNPSEDIIVGISYYVNDPKIHCRFVE